jgi:hypothetical protein
MTVCVGAICEDGNTAVLASDRMVTSSFPPIEFEHTKRKIFPLTEYTVALTSGNALKPIKIIPKIKTSLGKNPDVESIAEKAKELYQFLRAEEAEELLFKPRTISKEVFYTRGAGLFPADLFNMIDHEFVRYDYGLELLLVGTDSLGAHIYSIRNPGIADCFDTLGFHAIGVGYLHAIQVFIAHGYKTSYNIEEAINIVYAAKKAAEVAPGVGKETDISLITEGKVIDIDPEIISELSTIYDEARKSPIQEIKEKSDRLKSLISKRMKESKKSKPDAEDNRKGAVEENEGSNTHTEKATT